MKKLNLKNLNLQGNDLLKKEQLKSVVGGYDGFYCAYHYNACNVYISYSDFNACMMRWGC
ncbi:hypothetical protein [uncultured Maribacter sp.]|uniref:hypothetical protein n=1 Tax=uncultured Maribacter sp. TaxID=431308 RepID=UPI0030DB0730